MVTSLIAGYGSCLRNTQKFSIGVSAAGCQTNPMFFWADGTKVDILSDGSFVISVATEKMASLGGPGSERVFGIGLFVIAKYKKTFFSQRIKGDRPHAKRP